MSELKAGLKRKRKNAVDMKVLTERPAELPPGQRTVGRPSKGGESMRAKRYYAKNHLLILSKRRLRRYFVKVKSILIKYKYDSDSIKTEWCKKSKKFATKFHKELVEKDVLYFSDMGREDKYLRFVNEAAEHEMKGIMPRPTNIMKMTIQEIFSGHSVKIFELSTLWSAYLVVSFVESLIVQDIDPAQKQSEIQDRCLELYQIQYDHLQTQIDIKEEEQEYQILEDVERLENDINDYQTSEEELEGTSNVRKPKISSVRETKM